MPRKKKSTLRGRAIPRSLSVSLAGLRAGSALAVDSAVQFHGGMGFTYDCDAQLYIRRAQWSRQQFGDALHHRRLLASLLLD